MKRWLSIWLALCLCATFALAEETFEANEEVEEAMAAPVDGIVEETTGDLGDDEPAPQEETYIDDYPGVASWSRNDFYLNCPDVYDIRKVVSASNRVYPGSLVWPLRGTQPLTHLTSHVGWRNAARIHRGQGGTWASWLHHGIDVGHVTKRQVVVAADAGVAYAGEQRGNGLYVVIDHGNGFYTKYQHLSRFAGKMFDGCREIPVQAGDPIGYVGNSGGDYPVHFHFEIAWSPDGPGSDDATYHRETHNRKIVAYSFAQQSIVKLHWPETWELCSAEYQTFISAPETPDPADTDIEAEDEAQLADPEKEPDEDQY